MTTLLLKTVRKTVLAWMVFYYILCIIQLWGVLFQLIAALCHTRISSITVLSVIFASASCTLNAQIQISSVF
jgi:hypothetical protein